MVVLGEGAVSYGRGTHVAWLSVQSGRDDWRMCKGRCHHASANRPMARHVLSRWFHKWMSRNVFICGEIRLGSGTERGQAPEYHQSRLGTERGKAPSVPSCDPLMKRPPSKEVACVTPLISEPFMKGSYGQNLAKSKNSKIDSLSARPTPTKL